MAGLALSIFPWARRSAHSAAVAPVVPRRPVQVAAASAARRFQISDDVSSAMATVLRVKQVDLSGNLEDVEDRVIEACWQGPSPALGRGFPFSCIAPRIAAAIDEARRLGPINLNSGSRP